jgi:hypothetical protein
VHPFENALSSMNQPSVPMPTGTRSAGAIGCTVP